MFNLSDLSARVTGNLPKAILCIRSYNKDENAAAADSDRFENTMKAELNQLMNHAESLMDRADNVLSGKAMSLGRDSTGKNGFIEMEVQYNPNSITLDTQAGRQVQSSPDNPSQINIIQQPTATTMSFQLVFDDMNVSDSFMVNQGLTVGNAISAVSNAVSRLKSDEYQYTVKDKIDGLMSLLMHPNTRQVLFFWSQMCFQGEVTSVNSRYTMFDKEGRPVRGTVDLAIRQGDQETSAAVDFNNAYWDEKFDKVFGLAGLNMDFSDNGVQSKLGNVLNLWK